MSNGTLHSQLQKVHDGELVLSFKMRKYITLGVANGLAYLHKKCNLKNNYYNFNSSTIFLDEGYEALILDFEFCKVIDSMHTRLQLLTTLHLNVIPLEWIL